MGSTRLKGKVMKPIKGKPVIFYLLSQLKKSKLIDKIVVATSTKKENDVLVKFVKSLGFDVFRGSENDVLKRFYDCAKRYKAEIIVRITGDEPLIDPFIVDRVIRDHLSKKADYTSTKLKRTIPQGLDVEVFSINTLKVIYKLSKTKYEREHVTPFIYNNPNKFKINSFQTKKRYSPDLILTLDTLKDFKFIKRIIEKLYKERKIIKMEEIIKFVLKK